MPTESAQRAAEHIARFYGVSGMDLAQLAGIIDQHTLGMGRTARVSSMPDGDVKVEYTACGKVIDTKMYSPQAFSQFGRIAFLMGAHVTP